MSINNFKNFMENLWGNIPSVTRKPSDGWTKASQLSMSSNAKSGGGNSPMPPSSGASPMMMDKDEVKPKKKKYDQKN